MVYIYSGILLSHKKEQNIAMDGPRDYHTKWTKSNRERQTLHDVAYIWNFKNDINKLIYKAETDSRHRKQTCLAKRKGGWDR